ncbi:hypothetical protein CC77DRAFT_214442 [Alternaria alternata]|uniref:Uncharacterized protein n=1 Tax=Alternaria alternata TaxID=5599 RepID=A0A177DG47_ALTAL|nr:hypothetical protein CC77DRAFT_214442 [Alternaria alternata]KAH6858472.1 hypothetical protein B0T12DRAFT_412855 [Alternaria alternata]OAG18150.1 hypothetical protein CC77DRAFT_214442 [Alternaria alternata]
MILDCKRMRVLWLITAMDIQRSDRSVMDRQRDIFRLRSEAEYYRRAQEENELLRAELNGVWDVRARQYSISGRTSQGEKVSSRSESIVDRSSAPSRQGSFATSINSSIYTTNSKLPPRQQRLDDDRVMKVFEDEEPCCKFWYLLEGRKLPKSWRAEIVIRCRRPR